MDPLKSFVSYVQAQKTWSERTFGPGTREKGVIDHIRKELEEIKNASLDEKLAEWIDIIILGIDGAWRTGASPAQIAEALYAKQNKNFARVWPDWRTMSEDQAIEHDRSAEAIPFPYFCPTCQVQRLAFVCPTCQGTAIVNPAYVVRLEEESA